jgi:hypothetical protein
MVPHTLTPLHNEEIQKIWTEIQDKVASLARRDGRPVKTGMEIEDVMGTFSEV